MRSPSAVRSASGILRGATLTCSGAMAVAALSADGSVAISSTLQGKHDVLLTAWQSASERSLQTRRFPNGARVLGTSRTVALLEVANPASAETAGQQVFPDESRIVLWDLTSGKLEETSGLGRCENAAIALDGATFACGTTLIDRRTHRSIPGPPIAPDWKPEPKPDREPCVMCAPDDPMSDLFLSAWLAPDGNAMYLAYNGMEQHKEWRLEKWAIDVTGARADHFERLAVSDEQLFAQVLAASHDGQIVVTGGRRRALTAWRAPRYEPEPLPVGSANAATFSADDQQILTGHEDGRLCLWSAHTLRLLGSSTGR